ncbi:MAG: S1C family serine protease [Eubacterium sp.]
MSEFDEEKNKEEQARPDYYRPTGNTNGTYYTPPEKKEPEQSDGGEYHYSYVNNDDSSQNSGQSYNGYQGNSYYNPNSQSNYYSSDSGAGSPQNDNYNDDDNKKNKPKKSKAGIVILIVIIVCVCVAVAGIVASSLGIKSNSNDKESTSQSQNANEGDVTAQNSDEVATVDKDGNYTVAGVAKECIDSCVGITVYSQQASAYSYFYGYGSQGGSNSSEPSVSGEGSGVIMSEKDGKTYIMTCAHVISGGDSFKVTLNNKEEYDATMVAYDSQTDIGVLSIEATGLKVAEFANSENLVVGEQVVAIGCPGGLEFMNSVTSGYISALDRPVSSSIGYDNKCIQTDAAINPGNSGGALFNMQGQVIGINSSKIASTDYEGMGFAVPSSTAIATANSLIKSGYVEGRAKIGIQYNPLTSFNNASAILNALEEKGFKDAEGTMVINSVDDNSDLKNKDIKQYDMIVAVNGKTMTSTDVMTSILADSKPGDTIKLTIARIENNEIKTFEVECKLIESKG